MTISLLQEKMNLIIFLIQYTTCSNVRRNRHFDHFLSKMTDVLNFDKTSTIPIKLINQFGFKRCKKKQEDMNYKIL